MAFSEYPIHIAQLCVGLFVKLDDESVEDPQLRKGFKIKNEKQIEKLRASGLNHVYCILNRSERLPLPLDNVDLAPFQNGGTAATKEKQTATTPVSKELFGLKKETIERNLERRQRFASCEKRYDTTVNQVATLLRRVSGRSNEAVEQAKNVVEGLVDTFLSERDVLVNLITNKPKEEKQHLHSFNVTVLAMMLGKQLQLNSDAMRHLGMGAMFHDVGKGRMPINELTMGKATSLRFAVKKYYEQHPKKGAEIAMDLAGFPRQSVNVIYQHHERVDGTGFPRKLKGKEIYALAKIVSIANIYDNLCNKTDEKLRLSPHEAIKHLYVRERAHLSEKILNLFIRNMGIYPPGTCVQLTNGAIGMVISTNLSKPSRPAVMIYHPDIPKREALVVDLVIEDSLEIKQSLRTESLPREVFLYLSPSRQISYYADTLKD